MPAQPSIDPIALKLGRETNVQNAIAALLCGCGPAVVLAYAHLPSPGTWLIGLAAGFLWASFFEYALHRWLLHWADSYPGNEHMLHHASVGQPEEPLYANLGGHPIFVVVMFVMNGVPVILMDRVFDVSFAPGMLVAFSLYFILTEEIHWRFHTGGWVPAILREARLRHMAHHDFPNKDFSIFLPLFDRLLHTSAR